MKSERFSIIGRARETVQRLRVEKTTSIALGITFVAAGAVVLAATQYRAFSPVGGGWVAGTVADKDFVVDKDFQYVDETSTELRREAQAELVPPVFTLNALVT